ncbi:hypothetical protein EV360DRAFT_75607 [Lentinula raphanica]|nr:hypothetical protein EV360DRAFT_75607 [Lentinula raphanica]
MSTVKTHSEDDDEAEGIDVAKRHIEEILGLLAVVKTSSNSREFANEHGCHTHEGRCTKRRAFTTNLFDNHKKARLELEQASNNQIDVMTPDLPSPSDSTNHANDPVPQVAELPLHIEVENNGRPRRSQILPARYADFQRSSESAFRRQARDRVPSVSPESNSGSPPPSVAGRSPSVAGRSPSPSVVGSTVDKDATVNDDVFETELNDNGLFRVYYHSMPSRDPDSLLTVDDTADAPNFSRNEHGSGTPSQVFGPTTLPSEDSCAGATPWEPFRNVTTYRLMDWSYAHNSINATSLNGLVHDVILQDDFSTEHLEGFSAQAELERMDRHLSTATPISEQSESALPFAASDNWVTVRGQINR